MALIQRILICNNLYNRGTGRIYHFPRIGGPKVSPDLALVALKQIFSAGRNAKSIAVRVNPFPVAACVAIHISVFMPLVQVSIAGYDLRRIVVIIDRYSTLVRVHVDLAIGV